MKGPIKTTIEAKGQEYVDNPVYVWPKQKSTIETSVAAALNPGAHQPQPIQVGTEKIKLRWISPPKEEQNG